MKRLILPIVTIALAACSAEFDSAGASTPLARNDNEEWRSVFICENDDAVVMQHATDSTRYRLDFKNSDVKNYLGLVYRAKTEGSGTPTDGDQPFVGFSSLIARFDQGNADSAPWLIAHIFPDHGGLKVLVETEAFYHCDYDVLYGDSSGITHTVYSPIGARCPDLRPSYGFRNARAGSDVKTSRDWFFQNCRHTN